MTGLVSPVQVMRSTGLRSHRFEYGVLVLPVQKIEASKCRSGLHPGGFSQTITMRSGSPYGSGFNITPSMKLKIAVFGADSQRQRQHRHQRKSRTPCQHSRRITKVLKEGLHSAPFGRVPIGTVSSGRKLKEETTMPDHPELS